MAGAKLLKKVYEDFKNKEYIPFVKRHEGQFQMMIQFCKSMEQRFNDLAMRQNIITKCIVESDKLSDIDADRLNEMGKELQEQIKKAQEEIRKKQEEAAKAAEEGKAPVEAFPGQQPSSDAKPKDVVKEAMPKANESHRDEIIHKDPDNPSLGPDAEEKKPDLKLVDPQEQPLEGGVDLAEGPDQHVETVVENPNAEADPNETKDLSEVSGEVSVEESSDDKEPVEEMFNES